MTMYGRWSGVRSLMPTVRTCCIWGCRWVKGGQRRGPIMHFLMPSVGAIVRKRLGTRGEPLLLLLLMMASSWARMGRTSVRSSRSTSYVSVSKPTLTRRSCWRRVASRGKNGGHRSARHFPRILGNATLQFNAVAVRGRCPRRGLQLRGFGRCHLHLRIHNFTLLNTSVIVSPTFLPFMILHVRISVGILAFTRFISDNFPKGSVSRRRLRSSSEL
jgi:hypothetical protein